MAASGDDLDDLLSDLNMDDLAGSDDEEQAQSVLADAGGEITVEEDELDDLLGDVEDAAGSDDDLDDLLAGLDDDTDDDPDAAGSDDDLDDLLADIDDGTDDDTDDAGSGDDLDDLLADIDDDTDDDTDDAGSDDDLDDLLADLDDDADDDTDDLMVDAATDDGNTAGTARLHSGDPEFAFGLMSADRPAPDRLQRKRFRLALMGDFSGRAARGLIETGDALAQRRAILLDPDTVEDVIESFATTLILPIGRDGTGVAVELGGLDDLHPDELYENVALFAELVGLRGQLAAGATAAGAADRLRAWGEAHGTPVSPPRKRSGGNAVPADLRLSDFQKLIGDSGGRLAEASPIEDLLARVVGPHIRAVPDADAAAMQTAVDAALSSAMRMLLHHPEFQSVEAQWRTIDLIARSIETDDTLEVILYDISAEEIGADLAAADDLSDSGFVRLLTDEPLDAENGRGGYSALVGLYTFEETPPHAELLGRIARVAAHVDAPFVAALSPGFLDVAKEDRHPLVAKAWDTLRGMPEAGHLGLASPRFLLRRPYGAKSEPIYEFDFEEFTMAEGLGGMLWANPAALVAILLAKSFRENGAHMSLGSIMSLGDMPFHVVTDRYGDQVALPCTERNLTLDKVEKAMARGVMPLVSIKGRDEIRLASFQSLAGGDILGPWSDVPPPPPSPPKPAPVAAADSDDDDLKDDTGDDDDDDLDLDDLLAGFGDDDDTDSDSDDDGDDSDIDADLAALLEDL